MDTEGNRFMIYESFDKYKSSGFSPAVCIIGSGPAGISLALQLEKHKIPCLIVEAGGLNYSPESQDAYKGQTIGDKYIGLDLARLRYFGGTSGHWEGWCRPLDAVDFEARVGIKNSGWPIKKKDLDPYSKETESILEIESFPEDIPVNDDLKEVFFNFSPPVRFGDKYQQHIKKSSLIRLLINSPLKDIVPINGKISHINLHSKNKDVQKVSAKHFVLCTGGIENSRILLWSNQLHNGGVVPDAQALGNYWMEHPAYGVADTVLFSFTKMRKKGGMRFYAPSEDYLRKHNIGNFGLRLLSGENLVKALIKDGICIAPKLFEPLARKVSSELVCNAALRLTWEQIPVSTNRIELNDEKDATGMPRVNLFWEKQDQDRLSAETAVKLFGTYLAKQDIGRVKVISWLADGKAYPDDDEILSFHHMGGTRMASTPKEGVVDANCKVFGVENLFIGGSSVFPTGGHTNPTYTIVQLALRLGDHIAKIDGKVKV
jgi:choline dehydrogenase-like flavoprotein